MLLPSLPPVVLIVTSVPFPAAPIAERERGGGREGGKEGGREKSKQASAYKGVRTHSFFLSQLIPEQGHLSSLVILHRKRKR